MKVTEIKIVRRVPEEEYGFTEYTASIELDEDDSVKESIATVSAQIDAAHSGEEEEAPAKPAPVSKSKKKAAAPEPEDDDSNDDDESTDDGEEAEETPAPAKAKGKAKAPKVQLYDRSEAHKEILAGVLNEVAPKSKKTPEGKAARKMASVKMKGQPFLDAEGEVLPEAKVMVKKFMTPKK